MARDNAAMPRLPGTRRRATAQAGARRALGIIQRLWRGGHPLRLRTIPTARRSAWPAR